MNRNELKEKIDKAKFAYYNTDTPIMSDKEYDQLIKEYGFEPSVGAPVLDKIEKINISDRPMLSLDKVHSLNEIKTFANKKNLIATIKCDGLSVRLIYENGQLIGANTRGDGKIGGNIFHHVHYIKNIPLTIPTKIRTLIDGEVIIFKQDFDENKFKNQRNAAAGGLSLLNMQEVKDRKMSFVVWDVFTDKKTYTYYTEKLNDAVSFGFNVVPNIETSDYQFAIDFCLKTAKEKGYPCDGVVFKFNDIQYGESLGSTEHHFKNAIAWKNVNEIYETEVKDIEWTMGRTGQLTPVLIYNDIDINGTTCNRASLHNISIMTELMGGAYPGQRVFIYKANEIIPQVESAQTNNPNHTPMIEIPKVCPYCGAPTEIRKDNNSEVLYCTNINCNTRLINRLDHFVGKKGLDIKGLSKATLEKLINWGWIIKIEDLFLLKNHRKEWINKSGFGIASVDKILNAIENGKVCNFSSFICAIGIPLIGKVASKTLEKEFITYSDFRNAIDQKDERLYHLEGIGEVMIEKLLNFNYNEADALYKWIVPIAVTPPLNETVLKDKVFCITGKIKNWKNRDDLKSFIESKGGKVTGSVTSKTSYLINNDTSSKTAKNLTAIKLHIPIINEDEFLTLINPPNENIEPSYLASAT